MDLSWREGGVGRHSRGRPYSAFLDDLHGGQTGTDARAVWMEVYYDDLDSPSISVPCLDFFGLPHGRPVAYYSALTSVQEAHGFNAYFPMPFRKRIRMELTNSGSKAINLYYQVDYTLEPFDSQEGYLHVIFNRENPTTLKEDFTIAAGLHGPGRFLGSSIGIRVQQDGMLWFGEGEFKVYRDGDTQLPTICGTGLEDYLGSAWGLSGAAYNLSFAIAFTGCAWYSKRPSITGGSIE